MATAKEVILILILALLPLNIVAMMLAIYIMARFEIDRNEDSQNRK